MKPISLVASFVVLLGVVLFQAGCASTATPLPPAAKTGLTDIKQSLVGATERLDAVVDTLRRIDDMRGDATALSTEYAQRFAALERSVEATRARLSTIRGPETFFDKWKTDLASISDTHLRSEGEVRYDSAKRSIDSLNRQIDALRDAFAPMYKNMQDVATYLKNDPTTAGVEKAGVTARRIISQHRDVTNKLNAVERSIDAMLK